MPAHPSTYPFEQQARAEAAAESLKTARVTTLVSVCLALAGALLGLTLGRASGMVQGWEVGLVASCAVFCVLVLGAMLVRPFDQIPWITPLCSVFFLGYLALGAVAAFARPSILQGLLVYLMWFFPLLAFNRFVNIKRYHRQLSVLIYGTAIALAMARIALVPTPEPERGILIVFCLSNSALVLVMGMFARYREAYIQASERGQALQATHEAVLASEERLRRLFANAPSGIGWVGMDGRCQHVNATFGRMVGHAPEQLLGMAFADLVALDARAAWYELLVEAQHTGKSDFFTELRLLGSQGKPLPVRLSFALVEGMAGDAKAMVFVCQGSSNA